jgi:Tfp pilus assembly protein PilX
MIKNSHQKNEGFALLMTIIVLGVIVSVGLTIIELTIKQVRLSSSAKDSEIAFHAANAGVECALYHRSYNEPSYSEIEVGNNLNPTCFDNTPTTRTVTELLNNADGVAYQHEWEFTWGDSSDRCSEINMISMLADSSGNDLSLSGMSSLVSGYPDGDVKTCDAGGLCTVLAVKGYNRPCSQKNSIGTLQREVLVQF